jgi:type II secretory pathway component PulM
MSNEPTSQRATLGCGTLILIALIVMFFSRPGTSELEKEVRNLKSEVGGLKAAVEKQTLAIESLEGKLPAAPINR